MLAIARIIYKSHVVTGKIANEAIALRRTGG